MNYFRNIVLLIFLSNALHAQEDIAEQDALFSLSAGIHKAFILVHSKELEKVSDSHPLGLQLDFAWQQRKKSAWDNCRCFPKLGASVQFWDFEDPEILGYGMNSYFFIEPEFGSSRLFRFSFRAGFGLSLLSNPYDSIENPYNYSYSTHLAFALVLSAKAAIRLSPRTWLDIAPYYNHISNGGVKDPNKGINYPSLSIGIGHAFEAPAYRDYNEESWDKATRKKRMDVSPFVSWKQMADEVHVFSPGIEVKYSSQVARINALTAGLEYLEDNFDKFRYENSSLQGECRKVSAAAGHEFLLGKMLFSQQLGIYLYNPDSDDDLLYQRYGLTYHFLDWFAAGINLKAHRNVADLVDFRLSISFSLGEKPMGK